MKRILPFAVVALAGCTTVAEPVVEVRVVPVPTPVACVEPEAIPPEPPTVGARFNGDAKHDLAILAPSAQALRKWGQDMRAMLEQCAAAAPAEVGEEAPADEDG